jgi:pescadillo protein
MCMLKTPDDVDFRIMSTFVEFYSIMLGFVNYKSYQDIGLIYPPKLSITNTQTDNKVKISTGTQNDFNEDYLSSLNCDFLKIVDEPDGATNGDVFSAVDEEDPEILEKAKLEQEALKKLQSLFKGLRFFLNREVPREQFVFAIRCFSGEVSWDKNTALGSTYQEEDESITHQIIDRNHTGKNNLNRYCFSEIINKVNKI